MLILILINVQYLQKVFLTLIKMNDQNYSSSGSHHPIKKSLQQNFQSPHPLMVFGKPWDLRHQRVKKLLVGN